MQQKNGIIKPIGQIRGLGQIRVSGLGYLYLPRILQRAMRVKKSGVAIDFFIGANCVLLIRPKTTLEEILQGLDILKADLKLRAFSPDDPPKGKADRELTQQSQFTIPKTEC